MRRQQPVVVFSSVATPFSKCRAFCRFILRAGHRTLSPKRFRRLRGGLFGWKFRGGGVAMPIKGSGQWASEDNDRFKGMSQFKVEDGGDVD